MLSRNTLLRTAQRLRSGADNGRWILPPITNEPPLSFGADSTDRELLRLAVDETLSTCPDIPLIINGKDVSTKNPSKKQVNPSNHKHVVSTYHTAGKEELAQAIEAALAARQGWSEMSYVDRISIFYKAAYLLSTTYRYEMLAAMMVGQGKSARQAEIDGTCELIDFLRFNAKYANDIYAEQPVDHDPSCWNKTDIRPLEGFVLAISPFNFTAIMGNLAAAPAIMGNTVILKPPGQNMRAGALIMKIFREAGLPDGVINFVQADPDVLQDALAHPSLAGVHFTGSTKVFKTILKTIGDHTYNDVYKSFPRVVGETGGKNFHWVHPSALETDDDVATVATQTIRGAFEYQGQKCSATSRLYVPKSKWRGARGLRENLVERTNVLCEEEGLVGDTAEVNTFMGGVIDKVAFDRLKGAIEKAKADDSVELLCGGKTDDSVGYHIYPTIFRVCDPNHWLLKEELFGPVLAVYVYDDARSRWSMEKHAEFLKSLATSTQYALTGAIFAKDRNVIRAATDILRDSSGNFYINDKCTGAVVGQQAFGGGRMSGTNDKSGSKLNLYRWCNIRSVKETFEWPVVDYCYPHQELDLSDHLHKGDIV